MLPTKGERVLAWGLLLGGLALIYEGVIHPFWVGPMVDTNRHIQDLQQREHRLNVLLAQGEPVRQRLEVTADGLAARPGFIGEASMELASAALLKRVEETVQAADPEARSCAINNQSPLPQESEAGRFLRISVRVHLRCGVPELSSVLHALESGRPRLFIANLNLLAQRSDSSESQGVGLEVTFDITGYLDPMVGASDGEQIDVP